MLGVLQKTFWRRAKDAGRSFFHIVVKHHTFQHLVLNARHLNPRCHWNFKSEDFVGQVSKLTHSISMGVSSPKLSSKLMPKYRILFHLLLHRQGCRSHKKRLSKSCEIFTKPFV